MLRSRYIEVKIPDITNLPTNATLGKKNPNASNLVKKAKYNTKIRKIENRITTYHDHDKYVTTQTFNKLTSEHFSARLAQANLAG